MLSYVEIATENGQEISVAPGEYDSKKVITIEVKEDDGQTFRLHVTLPELEEIARAGKFILKDNNNE